MAGFLTFVSLNVALNLGDHVAYLRALGEEVQELSFRRVEVQHDGVVHQVLSFAGYVVFILVRLY